MTIGLAHRVGAALLAGLFVTTLVVADTTPAVAAEYPSWSEVQAARASEKAQQDLIARLKNLIAQLTAEAAAAEQLAQKRGEEYQEADADFQEGATRAADLQTQLEEAEAEAEESYATAARSLTLLARHGGTDLTPRLFASSDGATDDLLSALGYTDRIGSTMQGIYGQASADAGAVSSLTAQAEVAAVALEELRDEAEEKREAALEAADAAQAAVDAQVEQQAVMEAQLVVLTSKRQATEKDYAAGQAALAAKRAAEKAAREAAARAAGAGAVSDDGWAKPVKGYITDGFGPRPRPIPGVRPVHLGTDIGAGCGTSIYAANSGKVVYSGWLGTYGNWILIDHGDGIETGYAHIRDGGRLVSRGDRVDAGELIAKVGTTGASTGCHLHFEVRRDGSAINPVPFMRNRGVRLG